MLGEGVLFIPCLMLEAAKLLPVGQIQPAACFVQSLNNSFYIFKLLKKSQKNIL